MTRILLTPWNQPKLDRATSGESAPKAVGITLDRGRLSNGGGFAALDATRAALGQGQLTPDQVREDETVRFIPEGQA
jgi:hypothetical protein